MPLSGENIKKRALKRVGRRIREMKKSSDTNERGKSGKGGKKGKGVERGKKC
jgi:hypothetical protein